jgi:tetratricopeptide (TPR) repeat protein
MKPFLIFALMGLSACSVNSLGHRPETCDPNERLADLVKEYNDCLTGKSGKGSEANHILIDCDRAKNQIERLSLEFPRHTPTLLQNATIAYDQREIVKAERYCDQLLSVEPMHAEGAILKARIAMENGNLPSARRLLAAQVGYAPGHSLLRETYAAVLYMSGDYPAADGQLTAAARLGAPNWRVAFHRGLIAESRKDLYKAKALYEECLVENPGFQPAEARLAGINAEGGVQ